MTNPTVDIIVPVWNQPFETRACLVSLLNAAQPDRLIIVNNGSNRETELMIDEFIDRLGDRALYIETERNIGFVPAVNRALARVESDWAMVIRSNSIANESFLERMTGLQPGADLPIGIISPACNPKASRCPCVRMETCDISFSGVMISRKMYEEIGGFDEGLDGSRWCLKDFQQRAASFGYLTVTVPSASITPGPELIFGSEERRRSIKMSSASTVQERWGGERHFAVYIPREAEESYLQLAMADILRIARFGHSINIFLHSRQHKMALQHAWNCMHTAITINKLPPLFPGRYLLKRLEQIKGQTLYLEIVKGVDGIPVPGVDSAIPFDVIRKIAKDKEQCRPLSQNS